MSRTDPRFNLRLPQELLTRIRADAKREGRSLNAHLVYLLRKHLESAGRR